MKTNRRHNCRLCVGFTIILWALSSGRGLANDYEMWVQRWGILDRSRLADYEARSGQLLNIYRDGAVLWDLKSGLALRRYLPLADASPFTREGYILDRHILLGGTYFISLLDKQNGQLIRSFDLEGHPLNSFVINKKQTLLAALTLSGTLFLWEIETGRRLHAIEAQQTSGAMEFSPDSRLLLCGSDERVATLWNVETGERQDEFNSPTEVNRVAFSDDGRRMLTAGHGDYWHTPRLIVWDIASRLPQQVIPRSVMDASFSGEIVRIVLQDGEVELWAPDRHEDPLPPAEWPTISAGKLPYVRVTRNHWMLYAPRDAASLSLKGPASAGAIPKISQETPRLTADDHFPLAISQDGHWLLTGGASHGNRPNRSALWNLHSGELQLELENEVLGEFHPDGHRIVLARDRKLVVLGVQTGEILKTLEITDEQSPYGAFTSLRFSPDGKRLLTAHGNWYDGNAGAILLWDFESGQLLRNYLPGSKAVMFAEMSRDEKWILAALTPGNDGSATVDQLSVFDAATGQLHKTRMFSPYGSTLGPVSMASGLVAGRSRPGTFDGKIHAGENALFTLPDISLRAHLPETSHPSSFSPDGQVVAGFESNQMLGFRDAESGGLLHAYQTQLHAIRPILFHPAQRLVCGALFDPWHRQEFRAIGVGFEEILTGELEAELTLFREPGSWLMTARKGAVNGAEPSLSRVTWRRPDSIHVIRDSLRTQQVVNPQRVAEAIAQPLKQGQSFRDQLRKMPKPVIPESHVQQPPDKTRFKNSSELQRQAAKSLREAGAVVETNLHDQVLSIQIEQPPITSDLLKQLRSTFGPERLDFIETGIHDEQLKQIGLLPSLKRLSLWEKSITDRGITNLAALWNLEVLDVHPTQVTATGLNTLRLLPNLKTIIVPESIRLEDLATLQKQHPDLEIIRKAAAAR